MDLGLKKRVDEGEMVQYCQITSLLDAMVLDIAELFKDGKKYKIEFNKKLHKANYSFNAISKELELLKSEYNLKELK